MAKAKIDPKAPVTVADLPDTIGKPKIGPRVFLYCDACGGQYSAEAGDYWNLPKDHVLTCGCNPRRPRKLRLVEKVTILRDVRPNA